VTPSQHHSVTTNNNLVAMLPTNFHSCFSLCDVLLDFFNRRQLKYKTTAYYTLHHTHAITHSTQLNTGMMMVMMKLPISVCAEKLETQFTRLHQNQELKPIRRVKKENGPIIRRSQSRVSMVRDLWRKGFTKKVSFSLE